MKSRRALIISVVCGLLAVIANSYYISQKEDFYGKKNELIPVLVATKDIQRYDAIDETMMRVEQVPKPFVQPLALTAKDRERLIGYIADVAIKTGEQILETKIARPGESRISILIAKDQRACTIAVDEISGVGGLIRPGDYVDIMGTFKSVDAKSRVATQAETLMVQQNIPILAVGRNYTFDRTPVGGRDKGIIPSSSGGGTSFSNVTVSVSARQCMDLTLAQQIGTLSLALRSYLNRMGGATDPALKDKHSTATSVTGIQAPLEITSRPKWLEIRGEQSLMVP